MRGSEVRVLPPWATGAAGVAWLSTAGLWPRLLTDPGSPLGTVLTAGGGKRSPTHSPWSGVPQVATPTPAPCALPGPAPRCLGGGCLVTIGLGKKKKKAKHKVVIVIYLRRRFWFSENRSSFYILTDGIRNVVREALTSASGFSPLRSWGKSAAPGAESAPPAGAARRRSRGALAAGCHFLP